MTNAEFIDRLIHNLITIEAAGRVVLAPQTLVSNNKELNTVVEKTLISTGYYHAIPGLLARLSRFLATEKGYLVLDLESPGYTNLLGEIKNGSSQLEEELEELEEESEVIFPGRNFTVSEYVKEVLDDIASEAEKIKACATVLEAKGRVK
ncbi:MAG: hypothetical protein WD077_11735 [Bacteroidia bacterium]